MCFSGKASRSQWLLYLRPLPQQEPRPALEDLGVGQILQHQDSAIDGGLLAVGTRLKLQYQDTGQIMVILGPLSVDSSVLIIVNSFRYPNF